MKSKKHTAVFYGIGVGPGDPELITVKAVKALGKSDYVFEAASRGEKESLAGMTARRHCRKKTKFIRLVFPMVKDRKILRTAWIENAKAVAEKLAAGFVCSFATIGDPMVYSTCSYLVNELRKIIPEISIEIIPGITSFQAAAAKACLPLAEDREVISIFPAYSPELVGKIKKASSDTYVIMKACKTREEIIRLAEEKGLSGIYASRLGLEGEHVVSDLSKADGLPEEYLSLFILKRHKGAKALRDNPKEF